MSKDRCVKCGSSRNRLAKLSLAQVFGAVVVPSPKVCTADGGKHEFKERITEQEED